MSTDTFCGSELASKTIIDSLLSFKAPKTKQTWQAVPAPPDLTSTNQPSLQAQRVLGMLEEAKRKAGIAVMVEHVIENLDRYAVSLGLELSQLLQQHYRLLIKYRGEVKRVKELVAVHEALMASQQQELLEGLRLGAMKTLSFLDEFDDFGLDDDDEDEEEQEVDEEVVFPAASEEEKLIAFPSSSTLTCRLPSGKDFCLGTRSGGSLACKSSGHAAVNSVGKSKASVVETPENSEEDYNQSALLTAETKAEAGNPWASPEPENPPESTARGGSVNEIKLRKSVVFPLQPELNDVMQKEAVLQKAVGSLCTLVGELADSFRTIIKKFLNDPSAVDIVHKNIPANSREAEFMDVMGELYDTAMLRVLTTPEQHQERQMYMEDVGKRIRVNRKILATLSMEYNSVANYQEEKEYVEKVELLKQLQLDTHQIKKFSDEAIRRNCAETQKLKMAEERVLDERNDMVNQDIEDLNGIVENAVARNREIENELRNEKYKLEQELEAFVKNYDDKMISKMENYEFVEMNHTEEKAQLAEMEEHFADLEKEYMLIMEERMSARHTVAVMRRTFRTTSMALKLIQAYYRSYVVRKAIAAEEKKRARQAKKSKAVGKGKSAGGK